MSILRQVLGEAFASVFRRPAAGPSSRPSVEPREKAAIGSPAVPEAVRTGQKVVILNWNRGENDPFTVANDTLRQHFRVCGKNVEVIEITEGDWPERLAKLAREGVEFAITWQGLGSAAKNGRGESIWEDFKVPLICIHGDHPSHMPPNHQLESRYCFHLYTNADFARYSNRHFRRKRSASMIDIPQLHREARLGQRTGEYFVVAKNIDDPTVTENSWRQRLDARVFDAYMRAAETLKSHIARESYVETHDVLDELIAVHHVDALSPDANPTGYHEYHSQLDHYLRSYKTITAVTAVREFPIRIYGRGWERIARDAPACHAFEAGRKMANSQDFYYSRFGIIDISPSKMLHDRTRRAMVNGTGFLSSANLGDRLANIGRFDSLFFSFRPGDLPSKCAAVLSDPDKHVALASEFADLYHETFHFRDFVNRIDHLAKLAAVL